MNKQLIYKIRENVNLYQYLKYNSYLYKDILRGNITVKDIEKRMKIDLKDTTIDKINNLNNKIETINTFLDILK